MHTLKLVKFLKRAKNILTMSAIICDHWWLWSYSARVLCISLYTYLAGWLTSSQVWWAGEGYRSSQV